MKTHILGAAALALPLLAAPAPAQDAEIVSVDAAVDAAVAAGLVETLLSGDPYTVFLPTTAALAGAPGDSVPNLLGGDPAELSRVIQGYVLPGTVRASDAMSMVEEGGGEATAETLAGTSITLGAADGSVTVNGAAVIAPNLSYGPLTVHVIDGVYLPG